MRINYDNCGHVVGLLSCRMEGEGRRNCFMRALFDGFSRVTDIGHQSRDYHALCCSVCSFLFPLSNYISLWPRDKNVQPSWAKANYQSTAAQRQHLPSGRCGGRGRISQLWQHVFCYLSCLTPLSLSCTPFLPLSLSIYMCCIITNLY